jgi:hypothetical protein
VITTTQPGYQELGHCLIFLAEDDEALTAYEQQILKLANRSYDLQQMSDKSNQRQKIRVQIVPGHRSLREMQASVL